VGSSTILIGGSMSDASANAAPFDARYAYVHSQPAPSSAYYSAARCQDAWTGWWGCWTGSTTAPGTYVTYRDAQAAHATYRGRPHPQKFFWTWYSLRDLGDAAGQGDGPGEVVAINRADLLTRYLNDYRFFLQKIGKSHDMIDLEPDFWGFARSLGNLHQVPARVSIANPKDCRSQEKQRRRPRPLSDRDDPQVRAEHRRGNARFLLRLAVRHQEMRQGLRGPRGQECRLPGHRCVGPRCGLVRTAGPRR
jgi:hypothetical protein